jgi:hypothetical protein
MRLTDSVLSCILASLGLSDDLEPICTADGELCLVAWYQLLVADSDNVELIFASLERQLGGL